MPGKFATKTDVAVSKSRDEIEQILDRYGADAFGYIREGLFAVIGFRMNGRQLRYRLPLPDRTSKEFTETDSGKWMRSDKAAQEKYEQAVRQRWRALGLVIKAKLEAIEIGISEFDDEFLSAIVLPDSQTVGDFMRPQIKEAYQTGRMPALLPSGSTSASLNEIRRVK